MKNRTATPLEIVLDMIQLIALIAVMVSVVGWSAAWILWACQLSVCVVVGILKYLARHPE